MPSLSTTAILLKAGVITAVNDITDSAKSLKVYPSPAQGQLNVDIPSKIAEPTQMTIYDASGKNVKSSVEAFDGHSPVKLNVSMLAKGYYVLQVQNKHFTGSKSFTVAR